MTDASILVYSVIAIVIVDNIYQRLQIRSLLSELRPASRKSDAVPSTDPCQISHDLTPIDAQPLRAENLAYEQTLVLKRCARCGMHVSLGYAGSWTITDFLKIKSDAAREIAELKGMLR